jgi:hypothetical protein
MNNIHKMIGYAAAINANITCYGLQQHTFTRTAFAGDGPVLPPMYFEIKTVEQYLILKFNIDIGSAIKPVFMIGELFKFIFK